MSIFSTLKARRTCTRVFGVNCVLHQKLHKVAMVKFFPEGACNYHAFGQKIFGIQDKTGPLLICTWFLKSLVHEIDFWTWFLSISNWIFTACPPIHLYLSSVLIDLWTWILKLIFCLIQTWLLLPVWSRQKIKFKNQFRELQISKIKCRSTVDQNMWFICMFYYLKKLPIQALTGKAVPPWVSRLEAFFL